MIAFYDDLSEVVRDAWQGGANDVTDAVTALLESYAEMVIVPLDEQTDIQTRAVMLDRIRQVKTPSTREGKP